MRYLRNLLFSGIGMVLVACATQTFPPDKAPEYITTREPTPFYSKIPKRAEEPAESLKVATRVKLLRKQTGYSLVLLEDARKGYVANAYITPLPPGSDVRPFGSPTESASTTKRRKRAFASPTPAPESTQASETPPAETAPAADAPASPDLEAPSGEVPAPTPAPEFPLEKPKFRL